MIKQIWRMIYKQYMERVNPIKYACKIGVNFGDKCHIYGKVCWGSEPWIINIGKNVYITDGVRFITHDGGTLLFRDQVPDLEITKPITIGNNVYIGNAVIILPGVTVGDCVVIGAGAVVTHDIPSNSVVAGVPAKRLKSYDEYFEKLKKESIHLGELVDEEKDKALMKYYGYSGNSSGVYW